MPNSFISGEKKAPNSDKKVYRLAPGDTTDYTVRYESLIKE